MQLTFFTLDRPLSCRWWNKCFIHLILLPFSRLVVILRFVLFITIRSTEEGAARAFTMRTRINLTFSPLFDSMEIVMCMPGKAASGAESGEV